MTGEVVQVTGEIDQIEITKKFVYYSIDSFINVIQKEIVWTLASIFVSGGPTTLSKTENDEKFFWRNLFPIAGRQKPSTINRNNLPLQERRSLASWYPRLQVHS